MHLLSQEVQDTLDMFLETHSNEIGDDTASVCMVPFLIFISQLDLKDHAEEYGNNPVTLWCAIYKNFAQEILEKIDEAYDQADVHDKEFVESTMIPIVGDSIDLDLTFEPTRLKFIAHSIKRCIAKIEGKYNINNRGGSGGDDDDDGASTLF